MTGRLLLTPADFPWLYGRFGAHVKRKAVRWTTTVVDADDVDQESWTRVGRRLPEKTLFYETEAAFKSYLNTVVRGAAQDLRKANSKADPVDPAPDDDVPGAEAFSQTGRVEDDALANLFSEAVTDLITRVKDTNLRAGLRNWYSHEVEGLTLSEIAAIEGVNVPAVSKRIKLAVFFLARRAKELGYKERPLNLLNQVQVAIAREGILEYAKFISGLLPPRKGEQFHGPAHAEAARYVVLTMIDGVAVQAAVAAVRGTLKGIPRARLERADVEYSFVGDQVIELYLWPTTGGAQSVERLYDYLRSPIRASHPFEEYLPPLAKGP